MLETGPYASAFLVFSYPNQCQPEMLVNGEPYRTIWVKKDDPKVIQIIDQRWLPHSFVIEDIATVAEMARAISDMHVRGAGLIGAAAGYGMYLATLEKDSQLQQAADLLLATRPTAVNLAWALNRQLEALSSLENTSVLQDKALRVATEIADEDAQYCAAIGQHGLPIIENMSRKKSEGVVNILTHCNAGWLAFVDHGSATAPIYAAFDAGIDLHVWVDETRPRNQGARLTAWELLQHGVPHTVIADNVGGHLMQQGLVDMVITGTDRTTRFGDVANKIGTYLKALAAFDNHVPFYVALPSSTFDWGIESGSDIPIERRGSEEVKYIQGLHDDGIKKVLLTPEQSPAINYGFDVTPARLVTALITERGICAANQDGIAALFPEQVPTGH